jgi:hypothetical protein
LIDLLMELYLDWRQECLAVGKAYERWSSVRVAERERAFAAYKAALDREELASAVYADRLHQVARVIGREQPGPPSSAPIATKALSN